MKTLELPTKAGAAALDFSERHHLPRRRSVSTPLELPVREGMAFHSLNGGEQILIVYPTLQRERILSEAVIFAGMDEAPFMTALDKKPVEAFQQGGEKGFYNILMPEQIKLLAAKFPDAPVKRQGDVWSIKLPLSWKDLGSAIQPIIEKKGLSRRERKRQTSLIRKRMMAGTSTVMRMNVLGTRHSVSGHYCFKRRLSIGGVRVKKCGVAEGILNAPDHAPVELTGSVHVLARTPHIRTMPVFQNLGHD